MYINIILFSIVFPRIAPIPTLSPLFPVSVFAIPSCKFLLQYMGGGPEPLLPLGAQEAPLVMNGKREFK